VNWLSGDSTGKNIISTGEGILTISYPDGGGTTLVINGPNITGKAGQATFYKKVIMLQDLQVDGAITVGGGVNLLTTESGYTKDQMNSTFNALNGTVTDTEIVSIPDLVIVPKADKATTYDKTEVDTLLAEKANDETTYSKTQVDSFFIRSDPYLVQDPLQKVFVSDPDRAGGNKLELSLSSVFTDSVNTKINETQVLALLAAHDPVTVESPVEKIRNGETGTYILRMDNSYFDTLDNKLDVSVANDMIVTLQSYTNTQLAGIITPSKINITSNTWPQITLKSNSTTITDPSEISFNRENINVKFITSIGLSGDTTRGAFWWAGGEDRINISCETGTVKIKSMLTSPVIQTNTIRANTADAVTIDDSMIINNNLTVSGTITASNSNPFWAAGRFNGSNLNKVVSSGRSDFDVERAAGFAAGVYRINFTTTHPRGINYITNATASAVQCGVMNDAGYTPTSTSVIVYSRAATGALVDSEMNFMVLA
jgi:hypothetical protein